MLEQLQQEEFWNVGVRRYGLKHLFEASSTKKVVNKMITKKDEEGRDVLTWDPKNYYQFGFEDFDEFKKNLSEMKVNLANLSPKERKEARWSDEFLKRTIAIEGFWEAPHQDTSRAVVELLKLIKSGKGHVITPLTSAIKAYEQSVLSLMGFESSTEYPQFQSQREDLLIWNKGTRLFVRQLVRERDSETDKEQSEQTPSEQGEQVSENKETEVQKLQDLLFGLDYSRMHLVQPTDTEEGHMKQLKEVFDEAVSRNYIGAGVRVNSLMSDEDGISVFEHCCAMLLACWISSQPSSVLLDEISAAYNGLDRLGGQYAGQFCPEAWKVMTQTWPRLTRNIQQGIQDSPNARPRDRRAWLEDGFPSLAGTNSSSAGNNSATQDSPTHESKSQSDPE